MKNLIYSSLLAFFFVFGVSLAQEKLTNGNFESGTASWSLVTQSGASATFDIDSLTPISGKKSGHVKLTTSTHAGYHIQLSQGFGVLNGKRYKMTYTIRASRDTVIQVTIGQNHTPYTGIWQTDREVTTTATTFHDSCDVFANDSVNFAFNLGRPDTTNMNFWFDDISIVESNQPPVEAATLIKAPGAEKISNGKFESGQASWALSLSGSGAATFNVDSVTTPIQGRASGHITITNSTGTESDIQLTQPLGILKGKRYYIAFKAYASQNIAVKVALRQNYSPFNDIAWRTDSLTKTAKVFFDTTSFIAADDANINLTFLFGNSGNNQVWIDYVSIIENTMPAALNIVIDGQRDSFYDGLTNPNDGKIYIPARAYVPDIGTPPLTNSNLSAIVWSAWDSSYIYYYAEVTDDIVMDNNSTNWSNDKMELKYDPDPTIIGTSGNIQVGLSAQDSTDALVAAAVDDLSFDKNLLDVYGKFWGGGSPTSADYARQQTLDGYILEWRIPLKYINTSTRFLHPGIGGKFGSVINFADNDSTARQHMISWAAKLADISWANPQLAGTVTFLPDNKLKWEAVNSQVPSTVNDSAQVWYFGSATSVRSSNNIPGYYKLMQNYPNPFNPTTTIEFSLPIKSDVRLMVINILGQEVREVATGSYEAGSHKVSLDASKLASGIYFYKLTAGKFSDVKKLVLLK